MVNKITYIKGKNEGLAKIITEKPTVKVVGRGILLGKEAQNHGAQV